MRVRAITTLAFALLGALLLGAASVSGAAPAHLDVVVDLVIDLDDTLIRWVRDAEGEPGRGQVVPADGTTIGEFRYRILDGAPEFLQSLMDTPGVRISFFSGGEESRNLQVLDQLILPDGRSARSIAYKIRSSHHAIAGGQDGNPAIAPDLFTGEKKKPLMEWLGPDASLDRVILVEDNGAWVLRGQEKNALLIGRPEALHPSDLSEYPQAEHPQGERGFIQYRNRLARARALIERVRAAEKPAEALWSLQWEWDPRAKTWNYRQSSFEDIALYREGRRLLARANEAYRFTTALPGKTPIGCIRGLLAKYGASAKTPSAAPAQRLGPAWDRD